MANPDHWWWVRGEEKENISYLLYLRTQVCDIKRGREGEGPNVVYTHNRTSSALKNIL